MRLFSKMSRVAQGPTQSPVYWVPAAVFSRVNLPGREADHSHPSVQWLRMNEPAHPLSHMPSPCAQGHFYLFTLICIVVCGLVNLIPLPYKVNVATDLPIRHFRLFGVAAWLVQTFRYLVFRVASHSYCRETAVEGHAWDSAQVPKRSDEHQFTELS